MVKLSDNYFYQAAYLYVLELSKLSEEEFKERIEEDDGEIEIVGLEKHREFYDTYKDLIHALLIEIDDGKYQFLQSSYNDFTRNIWTNVIMKKQNEIATDIPIDTVINYIVDFILDSIIKIITQGD